MSEDRALVPSPAALPDVADRLRHLQDRAVDFERASKSEGTRKVYRRAWARFQLWCAQHELPSAPTTPEAVRLFAVAAADGGVPHANGEPGEPLSMSSLNVMLAAIVFVHDQLFPGMPNPGRLPKKTLDGLRRALGRPASKKRWISTEQLQRMVRTFSADTPRGLRDRAILLCAFASGGRRRSEIVSMAVEDVQQTADGSLLWTLQRSKTDQAGEGHELLIPFIEGSWEDCPARTLMAWLKAAQIFDGPVFRHVDRHGRILDALSPQAVNDIVKRGVEAIGLDPEAYGAHSIRAGFATSMAREGVRIEDIMERTGHKSMAVAQQYVRAGRLLSDDDPVRRVLGGRKT